MATGDVKGLKEVTGPLFTEVNLNTLYDAKIANGDTITDTDTLALADANKWITFNNAGAKNITIPKNTFAVGDCIFIEQIGAGAFTLVGASGITVNGNKKSGGQYCAVGIYFRDATTDANVCTVIGGIA